MLITCLYWYDVTSFKEEELGFIANDVTNSPTNSGTHNYV